MRPAGNTADIGWGLVIAGGVRSVAMAAGAEGKVRAASLGRELYSVVYNRNTEKVLSRGMTGCRMSHSDGGQAVTLPGPATSPALPEELPGTCWEGWGGASDRCGSLLLGASPLKDLERKPQG